MSQLEFYRFIILDNNSHIVNERFTLHAFVTHCIGVAVSNFVLLRNKISRLDRSSSQKTVFLLTK